MMEPNGGKGKHPKGMQKKLLADELKKAEETGRVLAMEIARGKKKMAEQAREISRLKQEMADYDKGLTELHLLSNAIAIAFSLTYGKENATGEWEAEIPRVDVRLAKKYTCLTQPGKDAGTCKLLVKRKGLQ